MTEAEIVRQAMPLLARAQARQRGGEETLWLRVGDVRLAYYPRSGTHSWFTRTVEVARKGEVLAELRKIL